MGIILFISSYFFILSLVCFISCQGCCPQDALDQGATYNPTTGKCFKVFTKKVEWLTAVDDCKSIGSELGLPDVTNDAQFVNHLHDANIWIDVNDREEEGRYVNKAGDNVTVLLWANDEPSDDVQPWDQDCVILNRDRVWEDKPCEEKHAYVCEWRFNTEKDNSHVYFKNVMINSLCNYIESVTWNVTGLIGCARYCAYSDSCLLFAYSSVMTSYNCGLYEYLQGSNSTVAPEFQLYKPY